MISEKPGKIVIISSPSGGGKTSICRGLLIDERKKEGWRFSISHTTRQKREGEQHGKEYFFVTEEEFDQKAAEGFFAEHFKVHLYKYGTPCEQLDNVVEHGGVILLDVDVQGAAEILKEYPDAISIFVLPPSKEQLKERLHRRGTETPEQLEIRYNNAKQEMNEYRNFQYTVINEQLDSAINDVLEIIANHPAPHPCRTENINKEQITSIIS
jgi:guanylate kinase